MAIQAIGLLSPGHMGHAVGRVLLAHGAKVLTCLKGRSERTQELARKSGIESVPTYEHLVHTTDIVLSILVPAEAQNAAMTVAQALRNTGRQVIYVDCNAIAPATAREVGEIITEAGSLFVDAGILGAPPTRQGITRFYASGPDAEEFKKLNRYGLDIRIVGTEIGQASGFKMVYAALTKGMAAISTELLLAAWQMGLYDTLVKEFQESQTQRYTSIERSLPGMPIRARRWIGEMEEIAKTFENLGLTPKIYQGATDIYRLVAKTPLAEETPENADTNRTLAQTIKILSESLRELT